MRRIAVLALLVLPALAGCLSFEQEPTVRVQPGDFVVADLTRRVVNGSTGSWQDLHLYLGQELPGRLPPGWDANATRTAVPGLVAAMDGMMEGQTRQVGPLGPTQAFGVRRDELVDVFPRNASLPRTVANASAGETVERYGRTWQVGERNGTPVLEVSDGDVGVLLEDPRFFDPGAGTEMWRSELVGFNGTHLFVRHAAKEGESAVRAGVAGRITEINATHVVFDRNHPLAGERVAFTVTVDRIVFVEPGKTRAPDFSIRTLEGERFTLSEQRGQPVVLYFFATWCSACRTQTPHIVEVARTLGGNATVLAVSLDPNETPAQVEEYRDEYVPSSGGPGIKWAIDGQEGTSTVGSGLLATTYRVTSIPKQFVVGPSGLLQWAGTGVVPAAEIVAEARTG